MMAPPLIEAFSKNQKHIPLWMMRQAGRYLPEYRALRKKADHFWNLCFTPELAAEVTLQPIRRFQFDAAIIFSDILVIPKALGQSVDFLPDHGPKLEKIELSTFTKSTQWEHFDEELMPVYEAISLVRKELDASCALIGFAGAPWTLATYMLDLGNKKKDKKEYSQSLRLLDQPQEFQGLFTLLTDSIARHLINQIKAGAQVVQIFESWASVVPESLRKQVLFEPLAKIVHQIRQYYPQVPIIYFGKGVNGHYPELMEKYFSNEKNIALSLDSETDVMWAHKHIQLQACLQGNLDPIVLREGGEKMGLHVHRILSNLSHRPFIFNLGHGILPDTPIENVEQVIAQVRSYES